MMMGWILACTTDPHAGWFIGALSVFVDADGPAGESVVAEAGKEFRECLAEAEPVNPEGDRAALLREALDPVLHVVRANCRWESLAVHPDGLMVGTEWSWRSECIAENLDALMATIAAGEAPMATPVPACPTPASPVELTRSAYGAWAGDPDGTLGALDEEDLACLARAARPGPRTAAHGSRFTVWLWDDACTSVHRLTSRPGRLESVEGSFADGCLHERLILRQLPEEGPAMALPACRPDLSVRRTGQGG